MRRLAAGNSRLGLFLAVLVAGFAAGALVVYQAGRKGTSRSDAAGDSPLSDASQAILKSLSVPVEIRFYSLLDPASTSPELRAFSTRVDALLAAYEQSAPGRLKINRLTNLTEAASAASAEGLKPFNLSQGDACYLGLVVVGEGQKEVLDRIAPEWEAALQPDLSRAIARVSAPKAVLTATTADAARVDPEAIAQVRQTIANPESVALNDGKAALRLAAMKEVMGATEAAQKQIKAAQERLAAAQSSGSEAEQQAAMKQIQELQAAQVDQLQKIAARSRAQIQAWEQIKSK